MVHCMTLAIATIARLQERISSDETHVVVGEAVMVDVASSAKAEPTLSHLLVTFANAPLACSRPI